MTALSTRKPGLRILVIEDDDDWATMIRIWLKQAGWEEVEHRVSVEAGWRLLLAEPFGLVVLDLKLAGSDGFILCERIRKNPATRKIPIVMLTGQRDRRNAGLRSGADQFVAKTPNGAEFLAAVASILRRRDLNEGVVRYGDISLVPEKREVRVPRENPAVLPPQLFRFLWLLLEAMPGPISKENLARGLAGTKRKPLREDGLNLLVKRLRDALPQSLSQRITAIHGYGYLLVDPKS